MGVGEDWVCFDRPEERYGEMMYAWEDGRQAEKGQTNTDLVPGFERMDPVGHCCCITTGDRSGKMAKIINVTAAQITPPD